MHAHRCAVEHFLNFFFSSFFFLLPPVLYFPGQERFVSDIGSHSYVPHLASSLPCFLRYRQVGSYFSCSIHLFTPYKVLDFFALGNKLLMFLSVPISKLRFKKVNIHFPWYQENLYLAQTKRNAEISVCPGEENCSYSQKLRYIILNFFHPLHHHFEDLIVHVYTPRQQLKNATAYKNQIHCGGAHKGY